MGRLAGKVALISGGARGQGEAEVILFSKEGAKVVFGDVRDDEGRKLEEAVRSDGGDVTYVHLDVSKDADWRAAVETTVARYDRIDILVNNAGIGVFDRVEDATEEEWDNTMAVNAKGPFLGMKHVIPVMRRGGGGSIINVTSIAAHVGSKTGGATYVASKGAVRLLTKHVALHHAGEQIRCNEIYPGMIDTPMLQGAATDPVGLEDRLARIPLGRFGKPDDMAYAALYLASDESAFITGAELSVDGGITVQ